MSIAIVPLALFTMLMLAISLHGLTASGHFPRETRLPAMASGAGLAVLWLTILIVLACLLAGLFAAWRLIPWYAAVIGGGGGILVAPLVLQWFPDRFVDGKRGLISFAAVALLLSLLLLLLLS
jgi:hypothetical protein